MSARPISAGSTPTGDALRLQMECSIDELAELARRDIEPGRFFSEVLRRALQPGGASRVVLWQKASEDRWDVIAEMPSTSPRRSQQLDEHHQLLTEVAQDSQPRIVPQSAPNGEVQVFSPLRHARASVGILETTHLSQNGALPSAAFQFFAALGEITADFLSQQELQQLRRAKSLWQQWDQYQLRVEQSLDLSIVGAAVANDGRLITHCDRISVLVRSARRYEVKAISGVMKPDTRAGGVRSLELLASQAARTGQTVGFVPSNDSTVQVALENHLRASGAKCCGVVCVGTLSKDPSAPPLALIVFEKFEADEHWAEVQSRAELLAQRSLFALQAAIERQQIPWFGAWQVLRKGPRILQSGWLLPMVALVAIVLALIVIPADLTVSGHGELWPSIRRDVFASSSGVIDQLLVNHGDDVQPNQPLIVIRDPELEQDVPKISGDIATTTERLRGVQIARLTGGTAQDTTGRVRQLASEEEELKERLKTLERQQALVDERRQKLTLRSPIAGRVLTWDVTQHLSARPVERGQSLLTIGDTSGQWILEIHVADKDVGHLLRAQKNQGAGLVVNFQLPSEPGKTYQGNVRKVSPVSQSYDGSAGQVRIVVDFDRAQVEQLRPGATAVPRIYCGRRSLGYVWLHDLIDAIRIRMLY